MRAVLLPHSGSTSSRMGSRSLMLGPKNSYVPLGLPHGFSFQAQTKEQATGNVRAFIAQIPERLRMLTQRIGIELQDWAPDLTEASLATLGQWFVGQIQERTLTPSERAALLARM